MINYGYRFTTDSLDDPRIAELKALVKDMNQLDGVKTEWVPGKGMRKTRTHYWRVKVRGRGSRWTPEKIQAKRDAFRQTTGRDIGENYAKYRLAQDLPNWMAERHAVYLIKERVYR